MGDINYRIDFVETHRFDEAGGEYAELTAIVKPYDYRLAIEVAGGPGPGYERRLVVGRDILASKARAQRDALDAASDRT